MQRQPGSEAERAARDAERGFSLIEIMLVLAIIALVMGFLVGPKVYNSWKEARIKLAKMMAKDYVGAYTQWSLSAEDNCPQSLDELNKYRSKREDKDPWGNKFTMRCGSNGPEGQDFGVVSPGPDKKDGTEDDIKSWE